MTKKILFVAIAVSTIGFTSCNKEYTCECKTVSVTGETLGSSAMSTGKVSKSAGKKLCEGGSGDNSVNGVVMAVTTCKIK